MSANQNSDVVTLATYAADPIWVAWRTEQRNGAGKPTKVPKQASGANAAVDKKTTWASLAEVKKFTDKDGVGIVLTDLSDGSNLCGIDYDACMLDDDTVEPWAQRRLARLKTYAEFSPSGRGIKAFFRVPGMAFRDFREALGRWSATWPQEASPNNPATEDHKPQIELHAGHRYFTVTGNQVPGCPGEIRVIFFDELKALIDDLGPLPSAKVKTNGANGHAPDDGASVLTLLLDQASKGVHWHDSMLRATAMMVAQGWPDDAILAQAGAVTRPGYSIEQTRDELVVLLKGARNKGWTDTARKSAENEFQAEAPAPPRADPAEPQINARRKDVPMGHIAGSELSDEAIAQYVAYGRKANLSQILAYRGENMQWLIWNTVTKQWRVDSSKSPEVQWMVSTCIHDYVSQYGTEWTNSQKNGALSTSRTQQVTIRLGWLLEAKTRRARPTQFYLQAPSATWDLRTGETIPLEERKEMYDTRYTAVDPITSGKSLDTPLFDKLLLGLANGNAEVAEWVWHYLGYCMLGNPTEDCFLLVHGSGGNGKSRLNMVLRYILGGYYVPLSTEVLMKRGIGKHPTELNRLRGKRLAVISEANPKEQWNEALLKQITGGDMISARNMREDASEFASEAGLLVMVNDKPNITHASVALLRRFRMIGTEQRPAIADSKLAEKIMMFEAPALLTKLMQYARKVWNPEAGEYEHMGLPPVPAAMNAVAREFMSENDPFYAWLIAECDIGADVREEMESLAVLKGRYENWAKREGQGLAGLGGEAMNMKEFRGALQRMGIATTNERGGALKMRGGTGGGVDAAQGVRLKLKNVA